MSRAHCYLAPTSSLAFLAIPKVAATSIKRVVLEIGERPEWPTERIAEWRATTLEAKRRGRIVIGFVRHPIDRLVSCWADKAQFLSPTLRSLGFHEGMSFEDFALQACEVADEDHHLRPQWKFVLHSGRWCVDVLGRFESLDRDWSAVQRAYGVPSLPHVNRTHHDHWLKYLTPRVNGAVREVYGRDFRLFGYAG